MRGAFEIFSRYSRLAAYDGLDAGVISAADEWFPMVNALRQLVLRIYERGVDPLDLLVAWTAAIASKNRRRLGPSAGLYQGTIDEFLEFLPSYLRLNGRLDPLTAEMIRWERDKNVFRVDASRLRHAQSIKAPGDDKVYTNPSIVTDYFEHAGEFLPGNEHLGAGTFAFYARREGTAAIVCLAEIALVILAVAKQGITSDELCDEIETFIDDPDADSIAGRHALVRVIEELQRADLLISATLSDEMGLPARATHEGIKHGYIPLVT